MISSKLSDWRSLTFGNVTIYVEHLRCNRALIRYLADNLHQEDQSPLIWAWDRNSHRFLLSPDYGTSWEYVSEPIESIEPANAIAGQAGELVFTGKQGHIYVLSEGMVTQIESNQERYSWHGSWGADIGARGEIVFSEYQTRDVRPSEVVSIWRCTSLRSAAAERVLSRTSGRAPPIGEIRHFHTCVYIPESDVWIASSGDVGRHNRIWVSSDAGFQWRELHPICETPGFTEEQVLRLMRFTSIQYSNGWYLWMTDDDLGSGSPFFVRAKIQESVIYLSPEKLPGRNLVRNFVRIMGGKFLGISESKKQGRSPEVYLVDTSHNVQGMVELEGDIRGSCPFTKSIGSRQFRSGMGFTPHLGKVVFPGRGGVLRWRQAGRNDVSES